MKKLFIHSNGNVSLASGKGIIIKNGKNDKPIVRDVPDNFKRNQAKIKPLNKAETKASE